MYSLRKIGKLCGLDISVVRYWKEKGIWENIHHVLSIDGVLISEVAQKIMVLKWMDLFRKDLKLSFNEALNIAKKIPLVLEEKRDGETLFLVMTKGWSKNSRWQVNFFLIPKQAAGKLRIVSSAVRKGIYVVPVKLDELIIILQNEITKGTLTSEKMEEIFPKAA